MRVKNFVTLREVAKKAKETLTLLGNATIQDALDELVSRYGSRYALVVLDDGSTLRSRIMVLVSGQIILHSDIQSGRIEVRRCSNLPPPHLMWVERVS